MRLSPISKFKMQISNTQQCLSCYVYTIDICFKLYKLCKHAHTLTHTHTNDKIHSFALFPAPLS